MAFAGVCTHMQTHTKVCARHASRHVGTDRHKDQGPRHPAAHMNQPLPVKHYPADPRNLRASAPTATPGWAHPGLSSQAESLPWLPGPPGRSPACRATFLDGRQLPRVPGPRLGKAKGHEAASRLDVSSGQSQHSGQLQVENWLLTDTVAAKGQASPPGWWVARPRC